MEKPLLRALASIVFASWCGYSGHAAAATQTAFFDTLNTATTVLPAVNAGDTVFVDAWEVAGAGPSLTGVNIDLFDARGRDPKRGQLISRIGSNALVRWPL
jgi:hypothetical protein